MYILPGATNCGCMSSGKVGKSGFMSKSCAL